MDPEILIINDHQYSVPENFDQIISTTLLMTKQDEHISVSIIFVNNDEMIEFNSKYRGYTQSTDVLSFEAGELDPESGRIILGDIVVCYPYVMDQSKILNNNLQDELSLMIIHGLLHLLGYDHDNDSSKAQMWNLQDKILEVEKINVNQIPE
jgi:probable rRNA maturation factor